MSETGAGAGAGGAAQASPPTAATPGKVPAAANDNASPAVGLANGSEAATGKAAEKAAADGELFDVEQYGDRIGEFMVNGEKVRMTVREWARDVMRSKAAYKKFEEASAAKKQAESIVDAFTRSPGAVLQKLGPAAVKSALKQIISTQDPAARAAVEEAFAEIMADAQKPREQVDRESLESEREAIRREREELRREQKEARVTQAARVEQRKLTRSFKGALEKAGLPADPETMASMAQAASQLLEYGLALDEHGIAECAEIVREEHEKRSGSHRSRLQTLPPEKLAAELGEDALRALRQWDLQRVTGAQAPQQRPANDNGAPPREQPKRAKTFAQVAAELEAERRSGKLKF